MRWQRDPPAAQPVGAPPRPLVDRLLASRGLTRDDLDRALAGDATSPAWPLVDRRYVMQGAGTHGEQLAAEPPG
jgi:hypothetical protein